MFGLNPKTIERIRDLTSKQMEDPNENVFTLLANTTEELGELSTAITAENKSKTKAYKKLKEKASDEAIDLLICAVALYFETNGVDEQMDAIANAKLDKWERNFNQGEDDAQ